MISTWYLLRNEVFFKKRFTGVHLFHKLGFNLLDWPVETFQADKLKNTAKLIWLGLYDVSNTAYSLTYIFHEAAKPPPYMEKQSWWLMKSAKISISDMRMLLGVETVVIWVYYHVVGLHGKLSDGFQLSAGIADPNKNNLEQMIPFARDYF